jgi:hypothetical protein
LIRIKHYNRGWVYDETVANEKQRWTGPNLEKPWEPEHCFPQTARLGQARARKNRVRVKDRGRTIYLRFVEIKIHSASEYRKIGMDDEKRSCL